MKKLCLAILSVLLLAGCTGNNSTNSTKVPDSIGANPSNDTSGSVNDDPNEVKFITGGLINNSLPSGWTFIKGTTETSKEQYYGNGGLKLQYTGDGVLSDVFGSQNHLEVTINIKSKNEKSNIENVGSDPFSFSVYGLDTTNTVVAAIGILRADAAVVGDHNLVLEGPAITQVRVIYSSSPYDGKYYNLSLGGVSVLGNNSGNNDITATTPEDSNNSNTGELPPPDPVGKLASPTNLVIDDEYMLTWTSVSHANQYRVFINKENNIVSDTRLDIFYLLEDGVTNTIKVQAIDTNGIYTTSDLTELKYDAGGPFAGITINETASNIKDAVHDVEGKTITVPSTKLSHDATGNTPDIVIQFDYDKAKFKLTYESNSTVLYSEKVGTDLHLTFNQPGELIVNIIKIGDESYFYDHVKIIVEVAEASFKIGYYNEEYELIPLDETYSLVNIGGAYIWLDIILSEGEVAGEVTWTLVSGTVLQHDWSNEQGSYYTIVYAAHGQAVISATYCGETVFLTINVTL